MGARTPTAAQALAIQAITDVIHRYCRGMDRMDRELTLRTRAASGLVDIAGGGRYLDRLECIDGIWAFRHRQSVHDWDRVDPVLATLADAGAAPLIAPNNPETPIAAASRDRADPSYLYLSNQFPRT